MGEKDFQKIKRWIEVYTKSERERKKKTEGDDEDCLSVSGSYPITERNEFYTEIKRKQRGIHWENERERERERERKSLMKWRVT